MKDCSNIKADWTKLEKMVSVFSNPTNFAYHVGKDLLINGKNIYSEINTSITDYEGEKWSDFGGRAEIQDNNRCEYTASREFYEETIGSVMDIPTTMSKLQNKKNYINVLGNTLNNSKYHMYVLKIPYKDHHRNNFQSTLSFIKYSKENSKKHRSYMEYKYYEIEVCFY